jgi:hypothetical protein
MTTPKNPTPQGISALLADAAHPRAGQVEVRGGWSLTDGFYVYEDPLGGSVRVRYQLMRIEAQYDQSVAKAALRSYARTITGAGWAVEASEWELTVTAREDQP